MVRKEGRLGLIRDEETPLRPCDPARPQAITAFAILPLASYHGLSPGAGPRNRGGELWSMITPNHRRRRHYEI